MLLSSLFSAGNSSRASRSTSTRFGPICTSARRPWSLIFTRVPLVPRPRRRTSCPFLEGFTPLSSNSACDWSADANSFLTSLTLLRTPITSRMPAFCKRAMAVFSSFSAFPTKSSPRFRASPRTFSRDSVSLFCSWASSSWASSSRCRCALNSSSSVLVLFKESVSSRIKSIALLSSLSI